MQTNSSRRTQAAAVALAALGVVYGDIGTSPLYALKECFDPRHGLSPLPGNVLGVLSLILWTLILLVSGKYVALILRADNHGEGGILAMLALAIPPRILAQGGRHGALLAALGVLGAAMLYGDGTITPAITILGAMEGLKIAAAASEPWVVPLAVVVLVALFSVQRFGTTGVGRVFGPVMLAWFVVIAGLGLGELIQAPAVLRAINPWYGFRLLMDHGPQGLVILSAVFLVVTGAEALYADMGHFGRLPIQRAWFAVVLPALVLNYLGQGALLLRDPLARVNPFFKLAPDWAVIPLVVLATLAAIIASQALISGAFSLTVQAMQLGYCPRMEVVHTSSTERGQIYVPQVNAFLLVACIALVLGYRSASGLAAAYGIAVVSTMVITTLLFFLAARRAWGWTSWQAGALCTALLAIESAFLAANAAKIFNGGWFPLLLASMIFALMITWKLGRNMLRVRLQASFLPLETFLDDIDVHPPPRVPGTAVFLSANPDGTPLALLHNFKHNKVLHGRIVMMTVLTADTPHVPSASRVTVEILRPEVFRVIARFGFMEDPTIPEVLERCREQDLELPLEETTFFLSRESIVPLTGRGWRTWRARLFAFLSRNAQSATAFFHLPANRVVELGMQVEL